MEPQTTNLKGKKAQYRWPPHWSSLFCRKVNNVFNIKSSQSQLVWVRRSTVLILPLRTGFPGQAIVLSTLRERLGEDHWSTVVHSTHKKQNNKNFKLSFFKLFEKNFWSIYVPFVSFLKFTKKFKNLLTSYFNFFLVRFTWPKICQYH